jgi:hypothetical protein
MVEGEREAGDLRLNERGDAFLRSSLLATQNEWLVSVFCWRRFCQLRNTVMTHFTYASWFANSVGVSLKDENHPKHYVRKRPLPRAPTVRSIYSGNTNQYITYRELKG